jgi:putative flippase GtrA
MLERLLQRQFIRFLCVGVLNTLFGYSMFALLLLFGLHYSLASFLGTVLGVLFNFKTTGSIVFGSHDNRRIIGFFVVYGCAYLVNVFGLYLFSAAHISAYYGGLILIVPLAVLSFYLNKLFVFTSAVDQNKKEP